MMKKLTTIIAAALLLPLQLGATKLIGVSIIDKDILCVQFRDGEVRYRDDATGPSAYLGHSFAEGDDTLVVFGRRLDCAVVADPSNWEIISDGKSFTPTAVYRKSKQMNTDHTLTGELDHWLYLRLPSSMEQGRRYTVAIPSESGCDTAAASLTFDIWNKVSEAVHVNIIGYVPGSQTNAADLYCWLGDGGPRDYSSFEGKKVWLLNTATGAKKEVSKVEFWKSQSAHSEEAGSKDLTGSDVWKIDFKEAVPGRYRLVVEDVGCSMDFDISDEAYFQPYRYSVRGYYYMRLGEPVDPEHVNPVPRQPRFIPGVDPAGFTVYKTDLQPWHPDWRKLRGDVWDEPHFKPAPASAFWQHRLPGCPVNVDVRGGHSDAFDWDRHLAHVSNIYDLLLPYILTGGRIGEDNLGIRESGNGIPDIIDEARNEVDFFLSIRDGEAYSQGVTNPSADWTVMFQAGCTTMAAWANAANCAMLAESFRILGDMELQGYYRAEAEKAFNFASRQQNLQLDDYQNIGTTSMRGRDFRQMAAAFLYNLTGDRKWEDIMAEESVVTSPASPIVQYAKTWGDKQYYQLWGTAAYLACPQPRHYADLYRNMVASVNWQADTQYVSGMYSRPSRRSANDPRWQTSENLQVVMLAHYIAADADRKAALERSMYAEAGWGLGRNPGNIVEMTGLGERHITSCYTTGRNDGTPESHPGQTPFNGTETWSPGNGGDARILLDRCYPSWYDGGWPRQESYFNQRYLWVNGEFTPRETMRGKMALLAYLYGIRQSAAPVEELGLDLTVVTSNVRYNEPEDGINRWDNRKDALVAEILSADPDIIGTQECLHYQRQYMKKALKGYETVGVARDDGKKDGEYSAIFYRKSRFKAIECGNFWLSETPDVPSIGWDAACIRIATWAFLEEKATGKRFFFINTHLDHVGGVARREGVNLLCRKAKEIGGDCPMVVTGDFNSGKESVDIQHVKDSGLLHTFDIAKEKKTGIASYHGFGGLENMAKYIPENQRPGLIDYIFISEGSCSYYEIMPEKSPDGRFVSDHCPVMAKVRL